MLRCNAYGLAGHPDMNQSHLAYEEVASVNQVLNGTFETGDLSGWTFSDPTHPIMGISSQYTWWYECYLFNKQGSFFLSGWNGGEENTGTLTSSTFTLGGSGFVTYRLGGGKNKSLCYIEFVDADTDEVLAKTYNQKYREMAKKHYYMGYPTDLSLDNEYQANMAEYKVDLSEFIGRHIYIRITDNAVNDWGLLFVDDFVTYYESAANIPAIYTLAEKF